MLEPESRRLYAGSGVGQVGNQEDYTTDLGFVT